MPNDLAYLMLLIWPAAVIALFGKMTPDRALIWSVLGGYLLLPPVAELNIPMVPSLNKVTIPVLSAYAAATVIAGHRVPLLPESAFGKLLAALFILAPFGTALSNNAPVFIALLATEPLPPLPPLSLYDGVSLSAQQVFYLMILALARRFLATPAALREVFVALVIAGLGYSLLMLIEIRMSPQLNVWVYGFFQHSFDQMIRFGGFRPIVFLEHGLWVAFFAATAVMAAIVLHRSSDGRHRRQLFWVVIYLSVVLVLCKTVGAIVYAVLLAPFLALAGKRVQIGIAAFLTLCVLAYPVLRANDLIPVDQMVRLAHLISADRAASLQFRFDNEAMLLARALEQPLFGWGGWNRNLVHDDYTGRVIAISDGRWVIVFGIFGWAGYIAEFGLLALPVLVLVRYAGRPELSFWASSLALIHAANLVDLLPNATATPLTWLLAGALLGYAEQTVRRERTRMTNRDPVSRPRTIL